MNRFKNAELMDINFIYGLDNRNGRVAVWVAWGKVPNEAVIELSNVYSSASEPGGTWILQNHD